MSIGPEMKMLVVVGIVFFVAGVSDGVVLNKCELKQKLEAAALTLPQGVNETTANLLAKIVCHVHLTSNFNTSAVKQITNPSNCSASRDNDQGNHKGKGGKGGRGRRAPPRKIRPSSSEEHSDSGEKHDAVKLWTLYGLFQLSDSVACNSTSGHSLNLCGLSCTKLIDDDISDDLACVQLLINKITATAVMPDRKAAELINKMILLIYQTECVNVVASSYFSDCSN